MKKILFGTLAIIICFAMVGCGNEEKNVKTSDNTSTQNAVDNSVEENNEEEIGEPFRPQVLVSDDTRYVVKISETAEYTYFHDGDVITGFQVKMYYSTPEAAVLAKKNIDEEKETNPSIDSIAIDGSNLIVRYKSSMYDGQTLNTIKMVYEYVGATSK